MEYNYTPELRVHYENMVALSNNLPVLLRASFWGRPSINDVLVYIATMAQARATFFSAVYKEWPQLNRKDVTANPFGIKLLNEEPHQED